LQNNILHRILICLLFFLFFNSNAISQTFPYYHYTTKNGLVNANVYYILQDKLGYIWFATNNGISRFDGKTFQNFYESDGLNSNSFTGIAMGEDSTLYFANFEKGINAYKNGKFSNYELSPSYSFSISTMSMGNDTFYMKNYNNCFSIIYNHKIERFLDTTNFKSNNNSIYSLYPYKNINSPSYKLLISKERGLYEFNNNYSPQIQLPETGNFPVYGVTEDKYKNLWLGCDGKILKYSDNKIEKTIILNKDIKGKVRKILVDSRGIIWFYPMNKGLFIFKDNEIYDIGAKISIGHTPINHIYEDRESNVWISTSGKGVFCFNNIFISNYSEKDGLSNNNINSILVNNKGEKLIGTFDGLNILEKNKFEKIITNEEANITNYIYEIKAGLNGNFLICGSYNLLSFEKKYYDNKMIFLTSSSACQIDSSTLAFDFNSYKITFINFAESKTLTFGDRDTFTKQWDIFNHKKIRMTHIESLFSDSVINFRINEIEKTNDGILWVGTGLGLCKINGVNKTYYKDDPVLNSKITSIKIIQPGNIFIAGDKGISVILQNPEKIVSLTKTSNFDFSSSTSIDIDNDNNIWIGNLKGLYLISLDSFLSGKFDDIIYFNEKTGLPSNEVHTISYDKLKNELWVGTADGLVKMELNDLRTYLIHPPKVLIEKIFLNDTNLTNFDNLVFKPSQNNPRIHYTSFYFNSPKSIKYEYKFEESRNWTETEYSDIDFFSLAPGKYNLLLRTVNINYIKSEITSLKFEILAPFWKTVWFYFLEILMVFILIIFIAKKRIKYIKNKSQEVIKTQNSISELRHQALSASMNPHFIFNTLNSIQAFMNTHGKEEANEYLVNFSRLIRMNLNLAEKTFISLETELARLELYLQYEKMRYEDKMEYSIQISPAIEPRNLMIPNMILQPFVENSIWHGLLHKDGRGTINISITQENLKINNSSLRVILIKIIDDGVGLTDIQKYKKPGHVSKGTSIIKERLRLLSHSIVNYEFVTIKNREDNSSGVIVTIVLTPDHFSFNNETETNI
jgi:ligand-binding sensor domain-containing protein